MLKRKDGAHVNPCAFWIRIAQHKLNIGRFQLIQHSYDTCTLNIIKDRHTRDKDVRRFIAMVKDILGCAQVTLNELKEPAKESSGKHIPFKCEVP